MSEEEVLRRERDELREQFKGAMKLARKVEKVRQRNGELENELARTKL